MANMFPRSWDIMFFMMLWSILASNGATGLGEKRALSHNLWCALLCQESCYKKQHFTYFLLVGGIRRQTFAVKEISVRQRVTAGRENVDDRWERSVVGRKAVLGQSSGPLSPPPPDPANAPELCPHNGVGILPLGDSRFFPSSAYSCSLHQTLPIILSQHQRKG